MHQLKSRRVAIVAGIVVPGVATAIAEYVLTGGLQGTWPVVAAVIGATVAAIAWGFLDRQANRNQVKTMQQVVVAQNTSIVLSPEHDGKTFSPRTSAELVRELKDLTTVAAQRAAERHIGLWKVVSISIWDVDVQSYYGRMRVTGKDVKDGTLLLLRFESTRWKIALETLNKGDRISALGRIERITDSFVSFKDCELLSHG